MQTLDINHIKLQDSYTLSWCCYMISWTLICYVLRLNTDLPHKYDRSAIPGLNIVHKEIVCVLTVMLIWLALDFKESTAKQYWQQLSVMFVWH